MYMKDASVSTTEQLLTIFRQFLDTCAEKCFHHINFTNADHFSLLIIITLLHIKFERQTIQFYTMFFSVICQQRTIRWCTFMKLKNVFNKSFLGLQCHSTEWFKVARYISYILESDTLLQIKSKVYNFILFAISKHIIFVHQDC